MANKLFMGVDTSCYTTSIAFIDGEGQLVYQDKKMLKVKSGQKGLRQSEGFYQHVFNLEELFSRACASIEVKDIAEIIVSEKPRDLKDSYMPVFTSGLVFAKTLSSALKIPIRLSTHQQNHILATMYGLNLDIHQSYVSMHLSGGTTDILRSTWTGHQLDVDHLGGSLDISFGQLIDRLGLMMDYDFPCGKAMDEDTINQRSKALFPVKIKSLDFNLSGYENKCKAMILSNKDEVIVTLFNTIVKIIDKIIESNFANQAIILTGGVSANSRLKKHFQDDEKVHLASSLFAMDHAIGNSYLGYLNWVKK